MNKTQKTYSILIIFFSLVYVSCVENLDFEQAENIVVDPTLEVALIYFEEPAATFVDDDGVEQETVQDSVAIDVFNDQFVVDNLVKAEFYVETTNSINREYEAQLDFLNNQNLVEHTITIQVENSPLNEDITSEHIEVFEGITLNALKNTTSIILTATLQESTDASVLTDTSPGNLKLKSKGVFYLNINTSE